jgi:predicted nucleic acid-binding protein
MIDNITSFNKYSVIDSCSVKNLVSTNTLYQAAQREKCQFIISNFIEYELLHRERKNIDSLTEDRIKELDQLIKKKINTGEIPKFDIDISDLFDPLIRNQSSLRSRGEITAIILARKFKIGMVTDDIKAQKIAKQNLTDDMVDSIPSLFGWLIYNKKLYDADKDKIISEQKYYYRSQEKQLGKVYRVALEKILVDNK